MGARDSILLSLLGPLKNGTLGAEVVDRKKAVHSDLCQAALRTFTVPPGDQCLLWGIKGVAGGRWRAGGRMGRNGCVLEL